MAPRKPFLLRVPPELLDELRSWAEDEMRSLNGQIEFLLRGALKMHRRSTEGDTTETGPDGDQPPTRRIS